MLKVLAMLHRSYSLRVDLEYTIYVAEHSISQKTIRGDKDRSCMWLVCAMQTSLE